VTVPGGGPTHDGDPWQPPEVMTLLRAADDEETARGWSWTTFPGYVYMHARNLVPTGRTAAWRDMRDRHVFRAEIKRDAILAAVGYGLEVVVDPELLGDVEKLPGYEWRAFPKPMRAPLVDGRVAKLPRMSEEEIASFPT
jgi:hypothetical protein